MSCLFVPGLGPSTSPCAWSAERGLCATSSGKPSPRASSWRGWQTRPWIQLLSGLICDPSTLDRGLGRWIWLLQATRANPSVPRGNDTLSWMRDTYGQRSVELLVNQRALWPSSRTFAATFRLGSPTSLATLPRSGSMQNGVCSAQPRLVRRTSASASSAWPTAATTDATSSARHSTKTGVMHAGTSLTDAIRLWGTPTSHDRTHVPRDVDHGEQLANQASQWATPRSRDWKDGVSDAKSSDVPLGRQVLRTTKDGASGSERPVLNPCFVEALMGMPPSWTVPTVSALSATEWSRWRRRMRSELLALG